MRDGNTAGRISAGSVREQAQRAREAARRLRNASPWRKRSSLAMADALEADVDKILAANREDVEAAEAKGTSKALIDRLTLNRERVAAAANGLREVAALPDPVGVTVSMARRPNGMEVGRVRVPLGVVAIIYEARPNVTIDAAGLCLKAGNAVILRGGSDAFRSNKAIVDVMRVLCEDVPPEQSIQMVEDTSRAGGGTDGLRAGGCAHSWGGGGYSERSANAKVP